MAGGQSARTLLREKSNRDTYTRLLAPQHLSFSHFRERRHIEGLQRDQEHPDYMGSVRLFKLDTIYGKIQMGYNPQRGEPFLLANIKTSIHDAAPSSHQRELREWDMTRQTKTETQNVAYTSRRWTGSTVLLYKREAKRWSREAVAPYLRRANMEALAKSMPFLEKSRETAQLQENRLEARQNQEELRALMAKRDYGAMEAVRRRARELLREQELLQTLLWRKDRQSLQFFRRLNMAYDWQKHDLFAYYRDRSRRQAGRRQEAEPVNNRGDKGEGDE